MSRRSNRKKGMKKKVRSNTARIGKLESMIERKAFSATALTDEGCDSTGFVQIISGMIEGLSEENRIGEKVSCKTIMIRGIIENNNGTPVDAVCRLLVFKNSAPNSVTQTIDNEVLDTITIDSMRDWSHKEIIKVYYDQTFNMEVQLNHITPFKIRVSGLSAHTTYSGSAGATANLLTNHYYFAFFSNQAAGANAPSLNAKFRITYDDI